MKRMAFLVVALAISGAVAFLVASLLSQARSSTRHAAQLARERASWLQEKAELESALENARAARPSSVLQEARAPLPTGRPKPTPAELVARLVSLKLSPGPGQSRAVRQALHAFEELISLGPDALPSIRGFLARNEDVEFGLAGQVRGRRAAVPDDFVIPPSLRFGLFDVVRQIGGPEAENLLAESLVTTGRGVELAWLARALQASAPDKYREAALAAARELLGRPPLADPASSLDLNDRDHLFSVLAMYGDSSYVSTAKEQLVRTDGGVDQSALRYLQQSLGAQAVPIVAQAYENPLLLTNAAAKEPLARLALSYVGADAAANEFYQRAIDDPILTRGHRKNLIEDLNQDGFTDTKNLTARDLPLIQNRIALIEQLAPNATDPVNIAAFKEAHKDLINMRDRITRPPGQAP